MAGEQPVKVPAQRPGTRIKAAPPGLEQREPWHPPELDLADVAAMRAVYNGTGNPDQQKRAMDCVIKKLCGVGTPPFVPGGSEGARATDLACGKLQVGIQLINLVSTKVVTGGEQP